MPLPLVTVLTSCYNGLPYLTESLESVLAQTHADFEFVVLDDGSTDGSWDVIAAYAARDPRIVAVRKPNSGLTDSLNQGLARARGEWIARFDADDVAMPDRLARQLAAARTTPGTVLVGSGCTIIDEQGAGLATYSYPTGPAFVRQLEELRSPFPHSSAFFSAAAVREAGGYRAHLNGAEDIDLWLRLSRLGSVVSLPEPLILLRKHGASVTHASYRHVVLSVAVMLSHVRRVAGLSDPSSADPATWAAFVAWSGDQLNHVGHHDLFLFQAERGEGGVLPTPAAWALSRLRSPGRLMRAARFVQSRAAGFRGLREAALEWRPPMAGGAA